MTTTVHTADSLAALDLGELRRVFSQATGLGCGTRRPETLARAILEHQAEAANGDDDKDSDTDQEPRDATVDTSEREAVDNDDLEDEPEQVTEAVGSNEHETDDDQETEAQHPEPTKVKVVGTGNNTGSTLVCDIVSSTGVIAVVKVLGKEVRFRTASGEPVRQKKSWQTAGWVLDTDSLPNLPEPTIEELAEMPTRDLSLAQLQQVYAHLSGRTSDSTSRTYLTNRIRLAKNGKLPRGTRRSHGGEAMKVIPVAMAVSVVEKMDEAWRKHGFPSRISFIRAALAKLLVELGEDEVAVLISG